MICYYGNGSVNQISIWYVEGSETVKKGLKKGKYKIRVKVTASGTANHNMQAKTVTVTIKVQ